MEERRQQPVITIRCTPELHKALKQLAFDNQISMNLFICDLLFKECQKAGLLNHENSNLHPTGCDNLNRSHENGHATPQPVPQTDSIQEH
jgi:hypothetical protein